MNQYCRYCAHALDYNGEGIDFICEADAPCGNNGAGAFYPSSKAKRINKCKYFLFNPNDVFSSNPDGSFSQYRPREFCTKKQKSEQAEQLELGGF